jgi:hypothetical protein
MIYRLEHILITEGTPFINFSVPSFDLEFLRTEMKKLHDKQHIGKYHIVKVEFLEDENSIRRDTPKDNKV